MSVFLTRGSKPPFYRNVSYTLANYLSEEKRSDLQAIVNDYPDADWTGFKSVLESETVTCWGATANYTAEFKQMEIGDYILYRMGSPEYPIRYLHQIDCLLGESIPLPARQSISELLWRDDSYLFPWFSTSQITELELPSSEFETLISDVEPNFDLTDWFGPMNSNFKMLDRPIVEKLGGETTFVQKLNEIAPSAARRPPEINHYYLLEGEEILEANDELVLASYFRKDDSDRESVSSDDRVKYFALPRTHPLQSEFKGAENNGWALISRGSELVAYGRIGNFSGTRFDGQLYDVVTIFDWHEIRYEIIDEQSQQTELLEKLAEYSLAEIPAATFHTLITTGSNPTQGENQPVDSPMRYFVLRTGSNEYADTRTQYEFRSGIPGYRQLLDSENVARVAFLEDGQFYAIGRIGEIDSEERIEEDSKLVYYQAAIEDYQLLDEPIKQGFAHHVFETNLNRPNGIIEIAESDFMRLLEEASEESTEETIPTSANHDLFAHLEDNPTASIYKFTAPPDYWYTSLRYGAISFEEEHEERWKSLKPGDIGIFHTRSTPSNPRLEEQSSGILGAGIVGRSYNKSREQEWWWDEYEGDVEYPHLVQFERIFVTEGADKLDLRDSLAKLYESRNLATIESHLKTLTANILPYTQANEMSQQLRGTDFPAQGSFAEFTSGNTEEHSALPQALIAAMADRLVELPAFHLTERFQGSIPDHVLNGLYFQNDTGERIRNQITAALRSQKHIIFTGPPGTGKTVIARRVAEHLADHYPYLYTGMQVTTATADWSTFETVGGYMPDTQAQTETLKFTPGSILNRLRDRQSSRPLNEPVVIDELNRADIDKAFGQLFTALTGESVQLPYTTIDGEEIRLISAEQLARAPRSHEYVIPTTWVILATMNTRDKTSLYDLSYAFMRRFTFIRVGAPTFESETEAENQLAHYLDVWELEDLNDEVTWTIARIWYALNSAVAERSVGPAIIKDMLAFVSNHDRIDDNTVTEAVISYILPQLEGVRDANVIAGKIAAVDGVNAEHLDQAARDMLQLKSLDIDG